MNKILEYLAIITFFGGVAYGCFNMAIAILCPPQDEKGRFMGGDYLLSGVLIIIVAFVIGKFFVFLSEI